ncbi:MAG: aspartate-semialdehyde dehydrogenase [Candidatus Borkfalkiaceae bacterium]|nr:aspartate-semialdehyde dehydrogenase [Christensenellaceae bacterium]
MNDFAKKLKVAVVGASGLVGEKILNLLENENFYGGNPLIFTSDKSAGKTFKFKNRRLKANVLTENSFYGIDIALFATSECVSKKFVPFALKSNATVIDNSTAFRLKKGVPLIVPEVNFNAYTGQKLIANPNCSTIQSVIPLYVLEKDFGIKSVVCATYQAVSGSGKTGLNELFISRKASKNLSGEFFGCDIKNNCIPKIGEYLPSGFTTEENKMLCESRKILGKPRLNLSAFCARVPAENCHGVFLRVKLKRDFCLNEVISAFKNSSEIKLVLPRDNNSPDCPINALANDTHEVFIGRIRKNPLEKNVIEFYAVADNLLRGAAYNAVLIARKVAEKIAEKTQTIACEKALK